MQKKLSQNLIVAINAASFGGAAIFGSIGILAAISNFTEGSWYIYGSGIESLIGGVAMSFFLAVLAFVLGVIAKSTIKKITNADLLKKSYGTLTVVACIIGALATTVAISVAIFALIVIGSKSYDQKELWLNSFLPAIIVSAITFCTAWFTRKISSGNIASLPLATNIVLGIASVSLLLTVISTIVVVYGTSSKSTGGSGKSYGLYDLIY